MKKLAILIAAVAFVCFSVPAMAVDWNFYGNARMQTFYTSDDLGDKETAGGDDGDSDLRWDLQGNSRLGVNVKAENIKGQVELGLKAKEGTGDEDVGTRRIYGVWNFGAGTLKVGKDYSPWTQFISGQVFDTDLGLLEFGAPYGGRPAQVALGFGGFEVAFLNQKDSQLTTDDGAATTAGDIDTMLPKFEASYGMSFDNFSFKVMGGYQYYSIEGVRSLVDGNRDDLDVTSYAIGGGGTFAFGPASIGAQIQYGRNMGNAGWLASYKGYDEARWDGDDDVNDVDSLGGILNATLKVSDMLSFEAGVGYQQNDPKDAPNGFDEKTKTYSAYLNSVIALAPGVFIVPEVGILDFGNDPQDDDDGKQFYLGGKWQINF
jgi:hypothetical protein